MWMACLLALACSEMTVWPLAATPAIAWTAATRIEAADGTELRCCVWDEAQAKKIACIGPDAEGA